MKESMHTLQGLFDTGLEGKSFYVNMLWSSTKAIVKITKCFNAKFGCDHCEILEDWWRI